MTKPLYADAGSGIIFNLSGTLTIADETLPEGVIMMPVQNKVETIVLAPGARLAGIRFRPAIGFGVMGRLYDRPTLLSPREDQLHNLYQIYTELRHIRESASLVETLLLWAASNLDFTNVIPDHLEKALDSIGKGERVGQSSKKTGTSQRHIERNFKRWLGMTPKHYQRVVRIKRALAFLRQHQNANLADVAHQFGFSDQAHMTREFRTIAHRTPRQE